MRSFALLVRATTLLEHRLVPSGFVRSSHDLRREGGHCRPYLMGEDETLGNNPIGFIIGLVPMTQGSASLDDAIAWQRQQRGIEIDRMRVVALDQIDLPLPH